ncbi:epoxide hydrolase family protein [Nonomuraea soli]|uniref:Pimeloyl-ACP methyl ester carboxylesterase n=1 Tax=Nonomuraea soli TaxID=1032476 RepID=A0A7W0CJY8_9ACTN|nr:epoxide hydrolase family protein [Nonomuraea soli]MBA2892558.1 pimeloyl-ACP methyl ester carboxylesterase [Nonomuraea soli]
MNPFAIDVPQADLDDLKERLSRTRWPSEIPGQGWQRGVPLDFLRDLVAYWGDGYSWRAQEALLNSYPQLMTTVDGQPVHLFHIRSASPDALPLILTHGWPSSNVEFIKLVDLLTKDFHLVMPSLPGYGWSTPVKEEGWGNIFRVAGAWATIMGRLGYTRYGVHGTDVGSGVAGLIPMVAPEAVVGVHISGPTPMPFGPPIDPAGLSPQDQERAARFNTFRSEGAGYLHIMSTRPQTLGYSLQDSPVGQLAWMVEKYREWSHDLSAIDRDQLLTNVTLTWFNGVGASSAHMVYEGMQAWKAMASSHEASDSAPDFAPPQGPPMGVAVFAADNSIRSAVGAAGAASHWSEFDRGGHFPAMEAPDLLADDLRAFFLP